MELLRDVFVQALAMVAVLAVIGLAPLFRVVVKDIELRLKERSSLFRVYSVSFLASDLHEISKVWPERPATCIHVEGLGEVFVIAEHPRAMTMISELLMTLDVKMKGLCVTEITKREDLQERF